MASLSPPATPAMSQDSTVFGVDSSITLDNAKAVAQQAVIRVKASTTARDIFVFLVAYRIVNALSIRTFFQPDEFFQSLEPAWEIAFGANAGAWITWLALTILSPWQWFCSARTLSNCLETTLTVVALNYWPWQWSSEHIEDTDEEREEQPGSPEPKDDDYVHVGEGSPRVSETSTMAQADEPQTNLDLSWAQNLSRICAENSLRLCLLLAALACTLRPTNLMIWMCLLFFATLRKKTYGYFMETRSFVLLCSTSIDLYYYRQLTFPPFRFLYFNIAQSLAVLYGQNRRDYYLTEGLPLLLTTYLPFAIVGISYALSQLQQESTLVNTSAFTRNVKYQIATTCLVVPAILSLVSHKEVRFIYPLLPLLHILASTPFTSFFLPAVSPAVPRHATRTLKRVLLALLLVLNVSIALFTTTSHQPGPINIMSYLRRQHATHYLSQPPPFTLAPAPSTMTVGFLMPCHSTPWRSHLVFPSIKAWALGCEPPVHLNTTARAKYVDEADQFYANPRLFLQNTLGMPPQPRRKSSSWWWPLGRLVASDKGAGKVKKGFGREEMVAADAWDGKPGRKAWPDYLAFFEEKEDLLKEVARGSAYRECWRGWNSWVHDDWRRRGDMIVWCLRTQKGKWTSWGSGWLG
ncbi:uncharacterized protein KY384_001941 [Bacidia gigantensis]|uniref:uncharacterized protein n=1 Tax=Bacidia gigantensis TaxID=2732470 RepID=UPI001D0478D0|nr:uncharacterized protein KY384_001941 [Bacidia gigantensis]KAG8533158.1 hypothetical protein KY384_001941 [Bacidia gigantensis]